MSEQLTTFEIEALDERFLAKVGPVSSAKDCWEWIGALGANGYGRFQWKGRVGVAHRFAYERWIGRVPEGLDLDHLCRNRACVNPDHLEVVTRAENLRRGAMTKLTAGQVHRIRYGKESPTKLAKLFGVSLYTVHDLRYKRTKWKDI